MSRRRRFEPSGLIVGMVFLAVAAGFGCQAAGLWHPRPWITVPVVGAGLLLAGITRVVTDLVRQHRDPALRDPDAGSPDAVSGGGAPR